MKKLNNNTWLLALKIYFKQTGKKYYVPKKGSVDYTNIKKIQKQLELKGNGFFTDFLGYGKPVDLGETLKLPSFVDTILDSSVGDELVKKLLLKLGKDVPIEIIQKVRKGLL